MGEHPTPPPDDKTPPTHDQMWAYKDLVDRFKPDSAAPADGSEEQRTMVGLRAVLARGENPFLPIAPEAEPPKPPADREQRHDFMAP